MNQDDTRNLLDRYVRNRDEDAFREIVTNYIGLVEATALRRVNNDAARARDITQIVFSDLARQAARMNSGALIGSWLYKHTCFVASKLVRSEDRRAAREKEASQMLTNDSENDAWAEVAPLLDSAMLELSADDQNAIILRFFEKRDLRSIGAAFNISDDAAQKRVQRAVEKLRDALHSKGVSIGIPTLSALLISKGVVSATAATATAIAASALASASAPSLVTAAATLMMSKLGLVLVGAGVVGVVAFLAAHKPPGPTETPAGRTSPSAPLATLQVPTNRSANLQASNSADTPINEFLRNLEIGVQGIDESKIDAALTTFWTQYDASSPEEQFQMRRAIPIITPLWKNASTKLKKTIIGTLERFRSATEEMVDIYIEALGREDLAHEGTAAVMFSGPSAAKATDKLVDQLKRNYRVNDSGPRDSSTARMTLEALANIGPAAYAAVPTVKEFLADTNMLYRVIGAKAYWRITGDADTVLPIFTKALKTENSFWSAQVLGEMREAAIPALEDLENVYANGPDWLRPYCYDAIRSIDRSRLPEPKNVIEALNDSNRITRMNAARLLWEEFRNPEQVVPTLTDIAGMVEYGMPKPEVEDAVKLLGEIGPPAESALPAIQKLLESRTGHSHVWIAATNAWRQIAPDKPIPSMQAR
ncbi:MAG TPA: sigma-70 family RNA polymerase sigma factor [Verrucomicrobiae bacterium]